MSSLFAARRKPKRVARDEPDNEVDSVEEGMYLPSPSQNSACNHTFSDFLRNSVSTSTDGERVDNGPVVRRPTSSAPKTKSKLRVSFNPSEEDGTGTGDSTPAEGGPVSRRTKPSARLGISSAAQDIISRREQEEQAIQGQNHERPNYNKSYRDELRNSTPSTPRDSAARDSPSRDLIQPSTNLELDLESKFGKAALTSSTSRIPTAAEIKEKKDRRARLAKEQAANAYTASDKGAGADFISLEDYDSDGEFRPQRMQVGNYVPPAREKDTRLIREDEDIAEGFDEFTEDAGRVTLSRKGLKDQARKERDAIRNMIQEAEGSGSDDDSNVDSASDSDYERRREYELAQTHHGMDGLSSHARHNRQMNRPRQPKQTTTIPKLSVGLTRLRDMVSALEFEKARIVKRQADIARERREVKESQEHIQRSLEEAGAELERVKREHAEKMNGAPGDTNGHVEGQGQASSSTTMGRGLESFGDNA